MLSMTGLNHFYYVRDFADMRCKHSHILFVICARLHRSPLTAILHRDVPQSANSPPVFFRQPFLQPVREEIRDRLPVSESGAERGKPLYSIDCKDVVMILENSIV